MGKRERRKSGHQSPRLLSVVVWTVAEFFYQSPSLLHVKLSSGFDSASLCACPNWLKGDNDSWGFPRSVILVSLNLFTLYFLKYM